MRPAPSGLTQIKMDAEARLYHGLDDSGIDYDVVEHQPVFTVAESSALHDQLPGTHSKNLFLKDNDAVFWLVTVPAEIRVDLKALPAVIGSKRLSFGKADDMERLIGLTPGSVTPLGAINAEPKSLNVVLDCEIAAAERVWVHPLRNSASLGIAGSDLLNQLRAWGHSPLISDIPRVTA
ncbi:prolyl-tRNA synthetase associated domain-containing protein [Sphingorhabdus sp.]|uniref:prolyl-tRNA synthetase associated domain-containing protein n=2 Tax=Sphingorhabdus sp. TaxID=1902408 RepID=UPI003BAFD5FA